MEDQYNAAVNQIIRQVINYWTDRSNAVTSFFNKYDDDVYYKEVAPGRSRAIYLFGHLIAISDALLPMLGLGEKLYPDHYATFVSAPDKSVPVIPSLAELKKCREKINGKLAEHFRTMSPADWLDRHMSISAEDFKREPMRNKLNVLINRTNHESYHLGQLVLLNP